jgi:hypothetical protein
MNILLIDVDSKIPNLALMKISTFCKNKGDTVKLIRLGISYYPKRRKHIDLWQLAEFDRIYVSAIFKGTIDYVHLHSISSDCVILYGGTGINPQIKLPEEIESLEPDYSAYPDNDTSYNFITRGCCRNCKFCIVPQKEGMIRQVNTIANIVRHKKVKFLDNNILAWKDHTKIFQELIDKNVKCCFNQGLDIRLINDKNMELLSKINYLGEYIFAFDNIKDKSIIEQKLKIVKKYIPLDYRIKFFIYCHPDMDIRNDVYYRVMWCKRHKVLPYLMRDIKCFEDRNSDFYTDLSAWCNQPNLFKKMKFETEYLLKRQPKNRERLINNLTLIGKRLKNDHKS